MKYKEGYWYRTEEVTECRIPFDCPEFSVDGGWVLKWGNRLTLQPRYSWDGASFILFRWFGTPKRWKVPSLYHDALYQAIREGKLGREYRDAVDCLFFHELRERGVSLIVATVAYYCVRIGGNFAVRKTNPVREVA